jgi:hypothetical protein
MKVNNSSLFLCLVLMSLLCLTSCGAETTPENKFGKTSETNPSRASESRQFRFMITLSPVDENAVTVSRVFLSNSQKLGSDTRIISRDNDYVLAELCTASEVNFPTPQISIKSDEPASIKAITAKQESSLNSISSKEKECDAKFSALINWAKHVGQYASDTTQAKKMIVFLQVPWAIQDIDDKAVQTLQYEMKKAAASKKIERIIIFGMNPNAAGKIAMIFQPFKQDRDQRLRFSTDIPQMNENLKEVHSQFVK